MRFYYRDIEQAELATLYEQSKDCARMAVLTGKRRIGKTSLAEKFAQNHEHIYLFCAKKSEPLLVQEHLEEIQSHFNVPVIGTLSEFRHIFSLLINLAREKRITVIIDEFQEFFSINPSVYSDIQNLWDKNKKTCKLNVIFIGSVYSLMYKIFENNSQPLFGRADRIIRLMPFTVNQLHHILSDNKLDHIEQLIDYYLFTGGIPKYIDLLITNHRKNRDEIIDFILQPNSPLLDEGKLVLIEEFGKNYGIYFSILELIARGKTSRAEIESIIQKDVGGYLDRLESDYHVIAKIRPINAKPEGKLVRYQIIDNFLRFWFFFIYKNKTAIENENFDHVKKIFERDINAFSGKTLEHLFTRLFIESKQFNQIGQYWESGQKNEIDLVAINELEKRLVIAEIKRNASKISIPKLKLKAKKLIASYPDYHIEWLALSPENISEWLEK